jgi:hypothetical protein
MARAAIPLTLVQLALDITFGVRADASRVGRDLAANGLLYLAINLIGLITAYMTEMYARHFFLRGTPGDLAWQKCCVIDVQAAILFPCSCVGCA